MKYTIRFNRLEAKKIPREKAEFRPLLNSKNHPFKSQLFESEEFLIFNFQFLIPFSLYLFSQIEQAFHKLLLVEYQQVGCFFSHPNKFNRYLKLVCNCQYHATLCRAI